MKYLLLLVLLASCSTPSYNKKKWIQTDTILTPESVLYDKGTNALYVSNINGGGDKIDGNGFISKLDIDGNIIKKKWAVGLNGPKGSRVYKDLLWVSDITSVAKISLKTGKVLKKIFIKGSKFLNDIEVDSNGDVYISDTIASKIYKIKNDIPSVFVKGSQYNSPNGLLIKNGSLYVAAWGLTTDWSTKIPGHLYKLDLKTKKMTNITQAPLGNLDGIEIHKSGDFIISDWVSGKVYLVNDKGEFRQVYQGVKGTADIGYIPQTDTLLVPDMLQNRVYSL